MPYSVISIIPYPIQGTNLVSGLLVQIHAAVQWHAINQIHGQNPAGRQLVHHFWYHEEWIISQQSPTDRTAW